MIKPKNNLLHRKTLLAMAIALSCGGYAHAAPLSSDSSGQQIYYGSTPEHSSHPIWPEKPEQRNESPNVLLIMTDDVGFGASSTFGGPIPTPTFDSLAKIGARYNDLNTTAMCSPSRASLLTGRNPHEVGMGQVTNFPAGYPGYNTVIPDSAGSVAKVLHSTGYSTAMFGKGHITPEWEMSQAGPFNRWPTGLGFQYFYGFLGADSSEFEPNLIENTSPVSRPSTSGEYNLDRDLADHAISWISEQHATAPGKPFFVYFSTAAAHAPNHAPTEWLNKFRGKFDMGWDNLRAETISKQIKLGIIPPDTKDVPRPTDLPEWASLDSEKKKIFARHMEAYAAQLANADAQIGRVIDDLKRQGLYENTIIIYIQGDNGAPEEGGTDGHLFDTSSLNGVSESITQRTERVNDIGTINSFPLIPGGWGWAMNAPFKWAKRYASHFGGTRNGMVISWPGHISQPEKIRTQFHHIRDIMPTILDATATPPPSMLNGVSQQPITGLSMTYTFSQPDAEPHRGRQVFALGEELAIYDKGWIAATKPVNSFFDHSPNPHVPLEKRVWELYHVSQDFNERNDLSTQKPEKLSSMKEAFWQEAAVSQILPVHPMDLSYQKARPDYRSGRKHFEFYHSIKNLAPSAAPSPIGTSFIIDADVYIPENGGKGILVAQGGRYSGYSLFLANGKLNFTYKLSPLHTVRLVSMDPVSPGHHQLTLRFKTDKSEAKSGGGLTMKIDKKTVAEGRLEQTFPLLIDVSEGFDVGMDSASPVDESYQSSQSDFNGTIQKITFDLE